jgi:hypothetical protein
VTAPHTLGRDALDDRDGGKNLRRDGDGIHDRCAELRSADDYDDSRCVNAGRDRLENGRQAVGCYGERLDAWGIVRPHRYRIRNGRCDQGMAVLVKEGDGVGYTLADLKGCHDSYPLIGKKLDRDSRNGQYHDDPVVMVPPTMRRAAMLKPFMEVHCDSECSTLGVGCHPTEYTHTESVL